MATRSRIVDINGNPIDLGLLAAPPAERLAQTAWLRREFDTHPARGLTPERLASVLLRGEQGDWLGQLDLASDIEERDGHAYSELSKRKQSIASLEWTLVPPKGASAAEKAQTAQLLEWMQALPDFEDTLLQLMDGVLYGLAAHAITWLPQGRVRLPQLEFAPQRWFVPDAARRSVLLRSQTSLAPNPPGLEELAPVMGEPLGAMQWMVHMPASRNGYLARSALVRVLAWPYLFKHYSIRDFAEFLEIYGLPLRLGKHPAGASDDEKRTLLQAVTEIGHNAAGIVPEGMAIDFQNAAQGTHVPFESMFKYMDAVQSKVIVGQTLSSGEGNSGTMALGRVHERVEKRISKSDSRQVESTITTQLLVPMGLINLPGFNPQRAPHFKLDFGEAEDLKLYADALPELVKVGVQVPEAWAREKLRIPTAGPNEAVLRVMETAAQRGPVSDADDEEDGAPGRRLNASRNQAAAAGALPAPGCPVHGTAALAGGTPPRDALDDLVDEAAAEWKPLMSPLVQPLLAELDRAVASGESLEAFAARLPSIVQQLDPAPLAAGLARASFVARLAGEADIGLNGRDS
jgi:phage gp29-like protein